MKRTLFRVGLFLWLLQFVSIAHCQYVTLTGNLQAANGLPASNFSISFAPSQFGFIAGTGVLVNTTTYCGTSTDGSVVGLPNPAVASVVTAAFTGSLPAGNYYVKYGWQSSTGTVTLLSPESVVNLTGTGSLNVPPPAAGAPGGASLMNVYIGTTSGSETFQGSITAGTVYMQTASLISGSAPPSGNNTVCKMVANDSIWPVGTGYTVSLSDPNGNVLPGYPMKWQLLGAGTTLNLSNGLPYYHGVVTFPSPILASPLNHSIQSITGPLSTSGFYFNGIAGITASEPVGSCTVTLQGGIITGWSGSGCASGGGGGGGGVSSINSNSGAFLFNGPGVVCSGTACTFSGNPTLNISVTTSASVSVTGSSGNFYNQSATAGTAITYTLPAPSVGSSFCFKNSYNGAAADTGTIEILVANTGTQSIIWNGAKSSSGFFQSSGAAGDSACVVGISSTQWEAYAQVGTWTLH